MNGNFLQKSLVMGVVILLVVTSMSAIANNKVNIVKEVEVDQIDIDKYLEQNWCDEEIQQKIKNALNNNDSGRYITFTGGVKASSFFVKLPRIFTQRGIIFSGEIWYRSPLALTIVFQRNKSGVKLVEFEKGTHRIIILGIGHSSFSRPHLFSSGRVIASSRIKPIII
ncbi:MAG: hypothetical protein JSW60_04270 [Thermoplasmatales archaeon]|nr:MAG: hypothetical protein JSW60_04270 [Thermoplasmatales archaeon]